MGCGSDRLHCNGGGLLGMICRCDVPGRKLRAARNVQRNAERAALRAHYRSKYRLAEVWPTVCSPPIGGLSLGVTYFLLFLCTFLIFVLLP